MAISPQMNSAATNYQGPPYVSSSGAPEVPEELRCQYASKHCDQTRTTKKCGGLHKFCAYHRENANRNQMRVDRRRRLAKQQAQIDVLKRKTMTTNGNGGAAGGATASFTQRGGRRSPRSERFDPVGRHTTSLVAGAQNPLEPLVFDSQPVLDPQDLFILQELLFHDDQLDAPMAMDTMDMDHPPAGAAVTMAAARNPFMEEYAAMNPPTQGVYLI